MTVKQDPKIIGFLTAHGWGEASFFPMTSDASARRYARLLQSGRSAVLMDARDVARTQTEQFCKISDLLRSHGLSAPEIYARDFSSWRILEIKCSPALWMVIQSVKMHFIAMQ